MIVLELDISHHVLLHSGGCMLRCAGPLGLCISPGIQGTSILAKAITKVEYIPCGDSRTNCIKLTAFVCGKSGTDSDVFGPLLFPCRCL